MKEEVEAQEEMEVQEEMEAKQYVVLGVIPIRKKYKHLNMSSCWHYHRIRIQ